MTDVISSRTAAAPRWRPAWKAVSGKVAQSLSIAGQMGITLVSLLWSAVRHPLGYWADTRDQLVECVRLCWIPVVVSTIAFGFGAPGLQGGNIYLLFGIPDRLGSFFLMASVREFAPWINAMVVAGVMGTAMTADLGARRIRDEIDALEVLGVDPYRTLVLPRVLAITVMTAALDIIALLCGVIGGFIASVYLGANPAAYVNNFFANATTPDIWGSVVKSLFFGLLIGVVCCFMGMNVKGGPIGVGKAVNNAVVTAFGAIWVFNYVYTDLLLGLNPDMQVFK